MAVDEDDLVTVQNDRIRALEMIVQVMATVFNVMQGDAMEDLRQMIDLRLVELETAEQLPGRGGASRRSLSARGTVRSVQRCGEVAPM